MSNVYEFQDQNLIEEEAAAWLIKLDGDQPPSAEIMAAFRQWRGLSALHASTFERYCQYWNNEAVLAELAIPLQSRSTSSAANSRFIAAYFAPLRRFAAAGMVAFTLLVGLSVTLQNGWGGPERGLAQVTYQTVVGEQQQQILADGSVVLLNTDTRLTVEYTEQHRKIILLQGEAHFEVESEPGRPFEVYAGSGMVRAVGTAFSVHLAEKDIEVLVSEGKVDLTDVAPEPLINKGARLVGVPVNDVVPERLGSLEAGQSAVFHSGKINNLQTLAAPELQRQQSWRSGVLTFKGDPLSQVVLEINRYTPATVEIIDPALNTIKIGGRFKVADIGGVFEVLETKFGIQVSRLNDERIQLGGAPGQ